MESVQDPEAKIVTDEWLLRATDEEIRDCVTQWCFDTGTMNARLKSGEAWQHVIQAHLYLDHVLTKLLTDALRDPEAIDLPRMSFYQKMALSKAMGIFPADLNGCVQGISKIRNRIAHDLNYEIDDIRINEIVSSLPNYCMEMLREFERGPTPTLGTISRVVIVFLETRRHHLAFIRLKKRQRDIGMQKAILHARKVLEDTVGRTLNTEPS